LPAWASQQVLIIETEPVTERLRVREIDDDEGRRLVPIIRRGSGSVVTWRRAQMVLVSAQGMDVAAIATVAFHQRGPGPRCDPQLFLEFCRYLRSLYPPAIRIAIICDNFSPTSARARTAGSGRGQRRTMSRSPTRRPIRPG
jgi:hypothetical protein